MGLFSSINVLNNTVFLGTDVNSSVFEEIFKTVGERYSNYRKNSENTKELLINEKKLVDLISSKENVTYDMDKIKEIVEISSSCEIHFTKWGYGNPWVDFADYFVGKKSALQVNDEKYNGYFTYLACISILSNIEFNNASLSWKLRIAKEKRKFEKK